MATGATARSFVVVDQSGERILLGSMGASPASVLHCELWAVWHLRRAPLSLAIGCDNTIVKGLRRGRQRCCGARRAHADVWARIWDIINDAFPDMADLEVKLSAADKEQYKEQILSRVASLNAIFAKVGEGVYEGGGGHWVMDANEVLKNSKIPDSIKLGNLSQVLAGKNA